jgi:hypothetical protein
MAGLSPGHSRFGERSVSSLSSESRARAPALHSRAAERDPAAKPACAACASLVSVYAVPDAFPPPVVPENRLSPCRCTPMLHYNIFGERMFRATACVQRCSRSGGLWKCGHRREIADCRTGRDRCGVQCNQKQPRQDQSANDDRYAADPGFPVHKPILLRTCHRHISNQYALRFDSRKTAVGARRLGLDGKRRCELGHT